MKVLEQKTKTKSISWKHISRNLCIQYAEVITRDIFVFFFILLILFSVTMIASRFYNIQNLAQFIKNMAYL